MKVICINATDCIGLTVGEEYDAVIPKTNDFTNSSVLIIKENDYGDDYVYYNRNRFKEVQS